MLRIDNLAVGIQGSLILRGISLRVGAGELVCLVGRNGAGKTTTFRTVMGYLKPISGTVQFRENAAASGVIVDTQLFLRAEAIIDEALAAERESLEEGAES